MALTDLTGTKWRFNSNLTLGDDLTAETYELNFNSNLHSYGILDIMTGVGEEPGEELIDALCYDTMPLEGNAVYGVSPDIPETYIWYDEAYRLIEITGGADATNANLIAFIQTNAEQVIVDTSVKLLKSGTSVIGKINGHYVSSVNGTNVMSGIVADTQAIISFSINGITRQAENGMTWSEWCTSEYNSDGIYIRGSFVYAGQNILVVSALDPVTPVQPSEEIVQNYAYSYFTPPLD